MMLYPDKPVLWLNHSFKIPWRVIQSWNRLVRVKCSLFVFSLTQFIEVKLSSKCWSDRTEESSVWQALRCETQSNREVMHPRWFFHLYIYSALLPQHWVLYAKVDSYIYYIYYKALHLILVHVDAFHPTAFIYHRLSANYHLSYMNFRSLELLQAQLCWI